MKKIMMLGAGPLQVPGIKKAKELGFFVYACDYDSNAVGFEYADKQLLISTLDCEAVLKAAEKIKPDYVITSTSDAPVRIAAYVCEKLGLPVDISYKNAICATVKSAMRKRLQECKVPIPEFYECHELQDFFRAIHQIGSDCVIKPADNSASRGVEFLSVNTTKEEQAQIYEYSRSFSRNGIVMVEDFMHGPEVSVECLVEFGQVHIVTITDKLVSPLPYFVELGHSEPSQLTESVKADIRKTAIAAVKSIGIINGCSHVEIKVTEDGAKVVELAARLGGDYITSKLVPLSTGMDMVGASICLSLHEAVDLSQPKSQGSAIRFLHSSHHGIMRQFRMTGNPKDMPGIKEIVFYVKPGDEINQVRSSNDRIGHVLAVGATAEEAVARAEAAMKCIEIEYM